MTFYYVTIFEENGRYDPKFDQNKTGQMNLIRMASTLGAKLVYRGEIQDADQGILLNKFVQEANKTGKFDGKKLDELLET